ncbi:hypothetical protein BegalDRAFT_2419 [Beggiatoa alba B18LD]|uniref:Uncharacterized protein n=1 Tax=Beggiatoa alba B18LD TaxID=395493 RepID=I3CI27_9GAMM|nr:hypothetical protein [Beggiatoa alba]EIJ43270.1 hypothetical protein BegalDRAFT_2419 [Beggiatoa alba B18LD]
MDEITTLLQEKLHDLEKAWVLETSPAHKFALGKQIEEVKAELVACGGQTAGSERKTQFGNISVGSVTGNVIIQQAGNDIVINRK